MISDETVEKILTETLANPAEMLEALREKLQSEYMLKVTKALQMKEFHGMAISAQEREAVASDKYQKAIDRVVTATVNYEKQKVEMERSRFTLEIYRTQQANQMYNI